MAVFCAAAVLLGILFFLSRRTGISKDITGVKAPFYRAAYFLLKKTGRYKKRPVSRLEADQMAGALAAAAIGLLATLALQGVAAGGDILLDGYRILRPEKGQGEKRQELVAEIEGSAQTEKIDLVIAERKYTEEEREAFLNQAEADLEKEVLGENTSVDEVRQKINLPETLADGNVTAEWTLDPADLLDGDGFPTEETLETLTEEGKLLKLRAVLACEGEERICEFALLLLPPVYSKEEQLLRALQKELDEADEKSAGEEALTLPTQVEGQTVTWKAPKTSVIGTGLLLTALAAVCVWLGKKKEERDRREKRKRQLILDYPEILFKLSMLLSAGLTMQNAFCKIALEYRARPGREIRYAYEEMLAAYYEMRSGMPEARAYENFGRRCEEPGYAKLGAMLSANLQKGSEGLAVLLQELAAASMEERRQMAKKLGEEAGTKLLMPMVLMLLVVLVILMVPAMLAF